MRFLEQAYWILSITLFVVVWETVHLLLNNFILPSPFEVAKVLIEIFASGEIFPHLFASINRTMAGFLFGLATGTIFGLALGLNPVFRRIISPIIELLRPIPPIAWIPMAILWFGVSDNAAVFIIFIASFFPIFTNVFFGLQSLPIIFLHVKQNYKLNQFQFLQHIILPFTTPFLLAGSKTGIGFSWMAVIAAEMISTNQGLGYYIEINRVLLKTGHVIATMIIIGLIGYCLHFIIVKLEKRFLVWRSTADV